MKKKFQTSESVKEFIYDESFTDFYEDKDFTKAFTTFADFLEQDKDLYQAYKDNIAMAFKDAFVGRRSELSINKLRLDILDLDYTYYITTEKWHEITNEAAENFLNMLITRNKKIS